jgi:hypothetical protein
MTLEYTSIKPKKTALHVNRFRFLPACSCISSWLNNYRKYFDLLYTNQGVQRSMTGLYNFLFFFVCVRASVKDLLHLSLAAVVTCRNMNEVCLCRSVDARFFFLSVLSSCTCLTCRRRVAHDGEQHCLFDDLLSVR